MIQHLAEICRVLCLGCEIHNPAEIAARRKIHQQLHQKPVELRFGQRIGALHLDRILCCHHQEWRRQRIGVFPLVTVRSCMASSSADCVFGVARLISSASTRFENIGPG